jgi:primosomal protein N' (replication factor Y)
VVVSSNDTKPKYTGLGPEEPAINRIRNEYIRTIIIKIPINFNSKYKDRIQKC